MGRGNSGGYGHRISKIDDDLYVLHWRYDNTYGRVRYPRGMSRDTNRAGALRFAKKWGIPMPESPRSGA